MSKRILTQWQALEAHMAHPGTGAWMPNINLYERSDGLVVLVELAGLAPRDVDVHVANHELIISGCRTDPVCPGEGGPRVARMEMNMGHFERILPLPCRVDGANATARCRHGLLEVHLPRREAAADPVDFRIHPATGEGS